MKKAKKESVSYKSLRTEFLLHFYLNKPCSINLQCHN